MDQVAPTSRDGQAGGAPAAEPSLPEPSVAYVGPVAVWFIPKPRGPRISLRACALAWLVLLPLATANLLWVHAQSDTWWPFGRSAMHLSEVLLRYELVVVVGLAYITAVSMPVWLGHRRAARSDMRALDLAIEGRQWERAGLLLHRYCLLTTAVWRKLPARVAAWDAVLRSHLPRHRRMYVYYRGRRPELPQDPASGFAITIVRPPRPSPWSAAGLIPIALMLYLLIDEVIRHGRPQQAFVFNTVLLGVLLVSYSTYFFTALLGRSSFLRFAPGVMQIVRYRALQRRPRIEAYELRRLNVVLDLSSKWAGLTLLNTPGYRREVFRIPADEEASQAVFRAVLSSVSSPPLPEDLLVD